jgi:NAD(P)-dependent dehydrogenase (short-subunit alcohol dehydrogenase family)
LVTEEGVQSVRLRISGASEIASKHGVIGLARAAIYPQNRVLEPREVAQVIAFLCGGAAGGVNGEAITVALGGVW